MFYIFEDASHTIWDESTVKLILQFGELYLFEHNNEYLCLKKITEKLYKIEFTDKYSFNNGVHDFENKDFYFYNYKVWPEIQVGFSEVDLSEFYKC